MSGKPPHATDRARDLRERQTFPERILWGRLRSSRPGLKFRRQYPIGPFIVDFCCPESRLIVELDGRSHDGKWQEDRSREAWLESQGWRVLRFTNDNVLHALDRVAERIAAECASISPHQRERRSKAAPSPVIAKRDDILSHEGRGEKPERKRLTP